MGPNAGVALHAVEHGQTGVVWQTYVGGRREALETKLVREVIEDAREGRVVLYDQDDALPAVQRRAVVLDRAAAQRGRLQHCGFG